MPMTRDAQLGKPFWTVFAELAESGNALVKR
jgi:hypothetical protein